MRGNATVTPTHHRTTFADHGRISSGIAIALVCVCSLFFSDLATAQDLTITGAVVDELGGAIVGAEVTVRDAAGAVVHTVAADAGGRFSIVGLRPGEYDVQAKNRLFEDAHTSVDVADGTSPFMLRLTMRVAGLTESLVVTGRRVEARRSETPQKIEIIAATDIERSVAADITDVLKKNAGVDVVQYNGVLSGVGIRGFRPEASGVNKRSLLLIDGRPSGITNQATLLLDNVDHIAVMKGPAS